jgi:PRC-barrel domain
VRLRGRRTTVRGRASDLLRLPVRVSGIRVGRPTDVLLELRACRAVGLEVACGDGAVRFLPIGAGRIDGDAIAIDSSFLLVDHAEQSFYRRRTRSLSDLGGARVLDREREVGLLEDVVLREEGRIAAVVLDDGRVVPNGPGLRLGPRDEASAA